MDWYVSHAGPSISRVKRKTMKKSEHETLSEALYIWFIQQREKGIPILGSFLKGKALQFYNQMENNCSQTEETFTASEGWLFRWKRRYNIRQLTICGERLSAENKLTELQKFKKRFHKMIERKALGGDQIYNCDETGLYYRMLPLKTLASIEEKSAPGYKKSKDRVTVLACSNVTGTHKMDLVVIGKSKNPRAFKNIKDKSLLPVDYRSQKSAWMNGAIFEDWFRNKFVPGVEKFLESKGLPRKAVLVIDNAPSHPSNLEDGDIKVCFFPPNVTSISQPMDQGVLECLKRRYRHKLLSCILSDDNINLLEKLKQVDMLDVVRWIANAWSEVQPITIVKSWRKILDHKASDQWGPVTTVDKVCGCLLYTSPSPRDRTRSRMPSSA